MDNNIKTCGVILFVKSIIEIIITVIGLTGGLFFTIAGKIATEKVSNTGDPMSDAVANCTTGFYGAIGMAIGIIVLIITLIVGICALLHFINGRKMLYEGSISSGACIILLILELLTTGISTTLLVILANDFKQSFIGVIIFAIIILQSIFTGVQLLKVRKQL